MVQGVTLLVAAVIVLVNLLTDSSTCSSTRASASAGGPRERASRSPRRSCPSPAPARRAPRLDPDRAARSSWSPSWPCSRSSATLIAPHDPNAQNLLVGAHPAEQARSGSAPTTSAATSSRARSWAPAPPSSGRILIALGAMLIGNALGLIAGYHGGLVDSTIMRWVDLMYALPGLLVAIVVVRCPGRRLLPRRRSPDPAHGALRHPHRARRDARATRRCRTSRPRARSASRRSASWSATSGRTCSRSWSPTRSSTSRSHSSRSPRSRSSDSASAPGTPDWGRMLAESRTLLFDNPGRCARARGCMLVITAASMNLDRRLAVRAPLGSRAGAMSAVPAATAPGADPLLDGARPRASRAHRRQPHSIVDRRRPRRRPGRDRRHRRRVRAAASR